MVASLIKHLLAFNTGRNPGVQVVWNFIKSDDPAEYRRRIIGRMQDSGNKQRLKPPQKTGISLQEQ